MPNVTVESRTELERIGLRSLIAISKTVGTKRNQLLKIVSIENKFTKYASLKARVKFADS